MSASPYIECDVPDCMMQDCPPGAKTFTEARAWLGRHGWHRITHHRGKPVSGRKGQPGRDICPDCWKEGLR